MLTGAVLFVSVKDFTAKRTKAAPSVHAFTADSGARRAVPQNTTTPARTVERLSRYRRLLHQLHQQGVLHIYSHQLAEYVGATAAQVRRDLLAVRYPGNPRRGYHVQGLAHSIDRFLDGPVPEPVVLVGVGNLGRALLAYFAGRRPNLVIAAAFDTAPDRVGRVIHGCRCYPMADLAAVVREQQVRMGVVTVPAPAAQEVADRLVAAGICGILNFAPATLTVPRTVHVETIDLTVSLEKVAFFSRQENSR
jgi:redox-sensing transcriptional repressor